MNSPSTATQSPSNYIQSLSSHLSSSSPSYLSATSPLTLKLSTHHLAYLLLRFEQEGFLKEGVEIAIDDLDEWKGSGRKPKKGLSFGGGQIRLESNGDDTKGGPVKSTEPSIKSFSGISTFSLGSSFISPVSSSSSWWSPFSLLTSKPPSPSQSLRAIFSFFTVLPSLHLHPTPLSSSSTSSLSASIEDFSLPSNQSLRLPLNACFKNLKFLRLESLDPKSFEGWHELSVGLKKLEVIEGGDGVEDDFGKMEEEGEAERVGEEWFDARWRSLHTLGLSSCSLPYFVPPPSSSPFQSIRSLSLSSNLLSSIPHLSSLPSLTSLNLNHNLISSISQIRLALPMNIQYLGLKGNRIKSLVGVEAMLCLKSLDIGENRIEEVLEISRLAGLPLLNSLKTDGNPFELTPDQRVEKEGGNRVRIFSYFERETKGRSKELEINGKKISWTESRWLDSMDFGRDSASSQHSPLQEGIVNSITAGSPKTQPQMMSNDRDSRNFNSDAQSITTANGVGINRSLAGVEVKSVAGTTGEKKAKRKKRVVRLDGGDEGEQDKDAIVANHDQQQNKAGEGGGEETNVKGEVIHTNGGENGSNQITNGVKKGNGIFSKVSNKNHSRGQSEYVSSPSRPSPPLHTSFFVIPSGSSSPSPPASPGKLDPSPSRQRFQPSTIGYSSPSTSSRLSLNGAFAPISTANLGNGIGGSGVGEFRKRIEELKNEMGSNWMRVLAETDVTHPKKDDNGETYSGETVQGREGQVKVKKVVKGRKGLGGSRREASTFN